jgi:ribosomal protein S18 acetylase RimI-like enzyme
MSASPPLASRQTPQRLQPTLAVTIRIAKESDLAALEWEGLFEEQREIIQAAYARQQQRSTVMLIAETGGRVVGQIWVDLTKFASRSAGFLWAFRVHPASRCCGIGTELLGAAEAWLAAHAFESGTIGVEKDNARAMCFCRRLGYVVAGELVERYTYTAPSGESHDVTIDQWLLEKRLLTSGVRQ